MKVIDLLVKIANGEEVSKKIIVDDNIYYYDETNSNDFYKYRTNGNELLTDYADLNDEVEIIEDTPEENNIKKIFALNTDSYAEDVYYERLSKEEICLDIQSLKHKINEIIDKVNGE